MQGLYSQRVDSRKTDLNVLSHSITWPILPLQKDCASGSQPQLQHASSTRPPLHTGAPHWISTIFNRQSASELLRPTVGRNYATFYSRVNSLAACTAQVSLRIACIPGSLPHALATKAAP